MNTQTDLFSLLDDPTFTPQALPAFVPPVRKPLETVSGWIKTYYGPPLPAGSVTSLPTLVQVQGDGHHYRPCTFALADGVTVDHYSGGLGLRGLRVKELIEMISLYDAVRRELAWEVSQEAGGGSAPCLMPTDGATRSARKTGAGADRQEPPSGRFTTCA